jgi:hypothetical protein
MQVRELSLERDDGMAVAGDVAGTASPGAHPPCGLGHGIDDSRMASHSEIVVRAPDDDLASIIATVPGGVGRPVSVPLKIGKNAIPAFPTHAVEI